MKRLNTHYMQMSADWTKVLIWKLDNNKVGCSKQFIIPLEQTSRILAAITEIKNAGYGVCFDKTMHKTRFYREAIQSELRNSCFVPTKEQDEA